MLSESRPSNMGSYTPNMSYSQRGLLFADESSLERTHFHLGATCALPLINSAHLSSNLDSPSRDSKPEHRHALQPIQLTFPKPLHNPEKKTHLIFHFARDICSRTTTLKTHRSPPLMLSLQETNPFIRKFLPLGRCMFPHGNMGSPKLLSVTYMNLFPRGNMRNLNNPQPNQTHAMGNPKRIQNPVTTYLL